MRLDRDWYTGAEDGGVAGDEEHNSLSIRVYSSLTNATLQKRVSVRQAQHVRLSFTYLSSLSKSSLRMPTTIYGKPTEWSLQV